jgi:hypothetical protein
LRPDLTLATYHCSRWTRSTLPARFLMTTKTLQKDDLLRLIEGKRRDLDGFLASAAPRKKRLLSITVWGGTLAAILTAGPAAGGATFTAWLTQTLGLTSPSWRLLCGAAAICSIAATLATQLLKSNNLEDKLTRALGARAKLEALEAGISIGYINHDDAAAQYLRCVEEVAFLRS